MKKGETREWYGEGEFSHTQTHIPQTHMPKYEIGISPTSWKITNMDIKTDVSLLQLHVNLNAIFFKCFLMHSYNIQTEQEKFWRYMAFWELTRLITLNHSILSF